MIPAKYLAQREPSESASLCYYLQQVGKPVGNPGASGKLGVVGRLSRSQGAGWGRSVSAGPRLPRLVPGAPAELPCSPRELSHCGLSGRWPYLHPSLPLKAPSLPCYI